MKKMAFCFFISLIGFSLQVANAQKWEQVGKKGDWASTVGVVALNGYLYSIEKDGSLFQTDENGTYTQLGKKGSFTNAEILAAMDGEIWTVENGSHCIVQTPVRQRGARSEKPETGKIRKLWWG